MVDQNQKKNINAFMDLIHCSRGINFSISCSCSYFVVKVNNILTYQKCIYDKNMHKHAQKYQISKCKQGVISMNIQPFYTPGFSDIVNK